MKFFVAVLIAAVTVNCLVMAINVKKDTNSATATATTTSSETVDVPFIDNLLPPFEDVQPEDKSKDAGAKNNTKVKAADKTSVTTTKKPLNNDLENALPELSIEALLPPLFDAKTEEEEEEEKKKATTVKPSTFTTRRIATTTRKPVKTTKKPLTTTTRRPTTTTRRTTTTTKRVTTTTFKPSPTVTTTLKPSNIEVPDLFLDSLLPPLVDNTITEEEPQKVEATTQKPKTTKKSYYQQQQQQPQQDKGQAKTYQKQQATKPKTINKPATTTSYQTTTDKIVAESRLQTKQVSPATQLQSQPQHNKLQSKIETMTKQHVAQQVAYTRQYGNQPTNYSFDFYLGSTTARPPKNGLPTITPFPHRLGR